jgi:hypothetical protein
MKWNLTDGVGGGAAGRGDDQLVGRCKGGKPDGDDDSADDMSEFKRHGHFLLKITPSLET